MGKLKTSLTKGAVLTGCLHVEKIQIDPHLSLCTKFKFKWIKDFNIKPDALNLMVKKVGKALDTLAQESNSLTKHQWLRL